MEVIVYPFISLNQDAIFIPTETDAVSLLISYRHPKL